MLLQLRGNALAIDLGTANMRIWARNGRSMVREASAVAYAPGRRRPVAVGHRALHLARREARDVQVVEPIKRAAVAEFSATAALLRAFLPQALERRMLISPPAVVAAPLETTGVQFRALRDAVRAAGVSSVHVVAKSLAASVGAGVPVDHTESVLAIDLGAGLTEVAVVSMGVVTWGRSIPVAGVDLDEALRRFVWRQTGLLLSRAAAEDIKLRVGAVDPSLAGDVAEIGSAVEAGDNSIASGDVAVLLAESLEPIFDEIQWGLDQLPPRQREEIARNGAVLTGGGALLKGVSQLFSARLGLRTTVAEDPLSATILGLAAIADDVASLSPDGEQTVRIGLYGRQ